MSAGSGSPATRSVPATDAAFAPDEVDVLAIVPPVDVAPAAVTVSSSGAARLPASATRQPAPSNAVATDRPIPVPAPTMPTCLS